MKPLVEIFLAAIDVIKAEARVLKGDAFKVGVMLAMIAGAGVFLVASLAIILVAFYFMLVDVATLHRSVAALLSGVVALAFAAGLLWTASRKRT